MSASTSALPPPECVTCKIPLQLKKDQDGNLRLLQSYICGRCGDEYPPKLTAEEEALRSEEERRRRQAQPSPTAPGVYKNCKDCGHDRATYETVLIFLLVP
nr:hypothetical protein Iba_chr03aCG9410 [Ipomoea batatas]